MSWYIIYSISEWVIRLTMLPIITSRRKPNAAMAWLLLIFFLPWVGWLLFLAFGTRQLPLLRRKRMKEARRHIREDVQRFADHPNIVHPDLGPELDATVKMAERLGNLPILGGNQVELISDTAEVIDRLVQDIDRAEHHVHLLFYIFWADETGQRVVEALGRAVERGVTCRVLVDDVGSRRTYKRLAAMMRRRGVDLHPMLPVGIFRRRMARIDLRNHRKLAVIDGRVGYTGSQNLVNASYGHKDLAWHDLMGRFTGPVVLELQVIFIGDWYQETQQALTGPDILVEPNLVGHVPVQTLPSGPVFPVENYQRLVVSALHGAQHRVIITTPYFVPDEPLWQAIQIAVLRGVQVDLIVPQRCDQRIVGAAARAYYADVLEAGANLYLHTDGLLHSKTMTVDDSIALTGSSNFDIRSFEINFELNMLLYGRDVTERLRKQQLAYLERSCKLDAAMWASRGAHKRLVENMARLMSPLL